MEAAGAAAALGQPGGRGNKHHRFLRKHITKQKDTSESTASSVAGPQVWKQRVLPLLWGHLAAQVDSVAAYELLYHEAALTNLLEVQTCE